MINKAYLNTKTIEKIHSEFTSKNDFPSVVLFRFLERESYMKLREQIVRLYYNIECVRTSHSYSLAVLPPVISKFFQSIELLNFISSITNKKIQQIEVKTYSFSWKDYTILSDEKLEEPGIDFIFDFTHDWDEKANGYIVYKDQKGNFISLPIAADMLAIVERREGVQRYVQYINHYAEKKKRYLVMGKIV